VVRLENDLVPIAIGEMICDEIMERYVRLSFIEALAHDNIFRETTTATQRFAQRTQCIDPKANNPYERQDLPGITAKCKTLNVKCKRIQNVKNDTNVKGQMAKCKVEAVS
jgi:hypothetical protein